MAASSSAAPTPHLLAANGRYAEMWRLQQAGQD
jgi:hypothetical protein